GARLGILAAFVTALGFALVALVLRASGSTSLLTLVSSGARAVAWVGGAPIALAVAHDRATADRRDGIDVLAAVHGVAPPLLATARAAAAVTEVLMAIMLPAVALALVLVPAAGSRAAMIAHAAASGAVAVFAVGAAVTVGGVASICGRVGRQ